MYSGQSLCVHESGSLYHGFEAARRQSSSSCRHGETRRGLEKRGLQADHCNASHLCQLVHGMLYVDAVQSIKLLLILALQRTSRVLLLPIHQQDTTIDSLEAPRSNEHKQS